MKKNVITKNLYFAMIVTSLMCIICLSGCDGNTTVKVNHNDSQTANLTGISDAPKSGGSSGIISSEDFQDSSAEGIYFESDGADDVDNNDIIILKLKRVTGCSEDSARLMKYRMEQNGLDITDIAKGNSDENGNYFIAVCDEGSICDVFYDSAYHITSILDESEGEYIYHDYSNGIDDSVDPGLYIYMDGSELHYYHLKGDGTVEDKEL